MFLENQEQPTIDAYLRLLASAASLTKLFSDNLHPFLYYRVAENAFCRAFDAVNVSRDDSSIDAVKDGCGLGIKTYLNINGSTFQKIAEFDQDRGRYAGRNPQETAEIVKRLRNNRLFTDLDIYELHAIFYHCIARQEGRLLIFEAPMEPIGTVRNIRPNGNTIRFSDDHNDYSFNLSKSTLLMRFNTPADTLNVDVHILDDPFTFLQNINLPTEQTDLDQIPYVVLPLYSEQGRIIVPERSGLNQWNARGRTRNPDEVYIPIPIWIHRKFPGFFPDRDTPFNLRLPGGRSIQAKVCQENGKALMSNPNSDLGNWLLRIVLHLAPREFATLRHLRSIGLDSAVVYKNGPNSYSIDLMETGSYEDFKRDFNN